MKDSTKRFSDRVANYVQFRPSYPVDLILTLEINNVISPETMIADIGSGTGIFTQLLVDTGCQVFAVEPNDEMRHAAEQILSEYVNFRSVKGQAETTNLDDHSVDVITVAQAFHWFDREKTRKEFLRILRNEGYVVLIWNDRIVDGIPFQKKYDLLIRKHCPEYGLTDHKNVTLDQIKEFYGSPKISQFTCKNYQTFDFASLRGRLESSSYCIKPDNPNYENLMNDLKMLFEEYQVNDKVCFEYNTMMYYGRFV